jgi:hypothetical protein
MMEKEFALQQENDRGKPGMSVFQRTIGALVSPEKTMKDIEGSPRVLFPILMMILVPVVYTLLRFPLYKEYIRYTMEATMELAGTNAGTTAEQMELIIKVVTISGLVTIPGQTLLIWLIGTAVIFGIVKLFKGQGRFKQFMSVTGYAFAVMILFYLVSFIVSFFSGEYYFNASLALFVPALKGSFIYGFLRSIDFFTIWQYVVAGIGISIVSRLRKIHIYTIIYGLYIIVALISANGAKLV